MRTRIIVTALLVILVTALGGFAYIWYAGSQEAPAQDPAPVAFPLATTSRPDLVEGGRQPMLIPTIDGREIAVRHFIGNGVTIEDPANAGAYFLAGSNGVCLEDGSCPRAGTEEGFNIVYFSDDQAFVVALTEEPLGERRRAAEQYLMQMLGLREPEMCLLRYIVGTTVYVNQVYGSIPNLGFSFCPGATQLP